MVIYTDQQGNEFELPKLTISLSEELAKAPQGKNTREQTKGIITFLKKVLPDDYVTEQIGGDKIEEVDLVAVRNMYDGVDNAYTQAMTSSQMERVTQQLQDVAPVLESLDKLSIVQNRQGFSRIK